MNPPPSGAPSGGSGSGGTGIGGGGTGNVPSGGSNVPSGGSEHGVGNTAPGAGGIEHGPSATADVPSTGATALSRSDQDFLRKMAEGNLFEQKTGHLAVEKGMSPKVKDLGQKMIDDHSKVQDQLQTLAQKKDFTLPRDLNAEQQSIYDKLSKLSGAEFDKAYLKALAKDHDVDVSMVKREVAKAQDPDIRSFAQQVLPAFQSHDKTVHGDMKSHTM